jgi:DNA-binding MarR family transcriptional regulator
MDQIIVRKFREILRGFERELDSQNNSSCCCGVTVSQCHALMELSKSDPMSLNQLSAQLGIDKSAASRTIESLVMKQMVERNIPKENRRTTELKLTRTGKNICRQINQGNDDYYSKLLDKIPADDLAVFLRTFERMVSHMIHLNRK